VVRLYNVSTRREIAAFRGLDKKQARPQSVTMAKW